MNLQQKINFLSVFLLYNYSLIKEMEYFIKKNYKFENQCYKKKKKK